MIKIRKKHLNENIALPTPEFGMIENEDNFVGPFDFIDWFSKYDKGAKPGEADYWKHIKPEIFDQIRVRFVLSGGLLDEYPNYKVIVGNTKCTKFNIDYFYKNSTSSTATRGIGKNYYGMCLNCSNEIIRDKIVPNWIFAVWGTNERGVNNWTLFYKEDFDLSQITND